MVDSLSARVVRLQSVDQWGRALRLKVDGCSARRHAALTISVNDVVLVVLKRRRTKIEVHRIVRHELRQKFCLCIIIDSIGAIVPIDEAASLRGVGVEVHEEFDAVFAFIEIFEDRLFGSLDSWMQFLSGLQVVTIEIFALSVEAPLASCNAVWVEHRDHLEYIVI